MSSASSNAEDIASKAWSSASVNNIYEQTRPGYTAESVEFLLDKIGALKQTSQEFVIVEVGAGTGKYTRPQCWKFCNSTVVRTSGLLQQSHSKKCVRNSRRWYLASKRFSVQQTIYVSKNNSQ